MSQMPGFPLVPPATADPQDARPVSDDAASPEELADDAQAAQQIGQRVDDDGALADEFEDLRPGSPADPS